jgi:hypothetical protein
MPPKKVKSDESKVEVTKSKVTKEEPVVETKGKTKPVKKEESESEEESKPVVKSTTKPKVKKEAEPVTKPKTKKQAEPANDSNSEPEVKATPKEVKSKSKPDTVTSEATLENLLEEKKKEWASITAQSLTINQERERLENEQKRLVKELTELMNKLKKETTEGFTFDSATKTPKTASKTLKKEIISMDAESDSESETSESESDSDDKPKLVAKKGKKTAPVKTTKGGKGLNLKKPDSDSESAEDSD